MRPRAVVLGVAWASLLGPAVASANGRYPAANRIVLSTSDPDLVVVRATYGVLRSQDRGSTWTFLCEDALGLPRMATEDPAFGLSPGGAWIIGLLIPPALDVSMDQGCTWNCVAGALSGQAVADIAVRLQDTSAVVALTMPSDEADASGGPAVFESLDDGAHWAQLGQSLDPSLLVATVEVAASDPNRLYVSATRGFGPTRTASLLVSLDHGSTWTERSVPLDPTVEAFVYIGGVDPTDADRVYIRTSAPAGQSGATRLLVTVDAGQSFQTALTLTGQMLGFALSPDGSKIYAGGNIDGLYVASKLTGSFAAVRSTVTGGDGGPESVHVECLATRGSELWACADEPSGFIAGVSTDDGATFEPKLHLDSIQGAIACPPNEAASALACDAEAGVSECAGGPFQQLCMNVGCTDAGTSSGPPGPSGESQVRRGCSSVGVPSAGLVAAVCVTAALGLARRRGRR